MAHSGTPDPAEDRTPQEPDITSSTPSTVPDLVSRRSLRNSEASSAALRAPKSKPAASTSVVAASERAKPAAKKRKGGWALNVAVMGCIVNGPGESKHADIGISLPGTGETPAAPVFIDGKKAVTLRGPTVAADFKKMVIDYIEKRYGAAGAGQRTAAE